MRCELAGRCSGCRWIDWEYERQSEAKIEMVRQALRAAGVSELEIGHRGAGAWRLRDRVDITLENGQLGLYGIEDSGIVDMAACPMMSPRLEAWLVEFRKNLPPGVRKGSIRLRVGPAGQRGVWLDFANLDVKALLDDGQWLGRLLDTGAFIEVGQRRKKLVRSENRLKLAEPELMNWFLTYVPEEFPLKSFVGSFTQPGFEANRVLVSAVMEIANQIEAKFWLELGSGIGNFTIPLARARKHVKAVELDELSVQALELNAQGEKSVEIIRGDFRNPKISEKLRGVQAVLCDPPRSGLGGFVEGLPSLGFPGDFIYVSCFADSFAADVARLAALGYRLKSVALVDQFPQTPHVEIVSHLKRENQ